MARPQKSGMDYFPHDTDALTDEKIESLRMLYGNDGYAFYFIMLERIYRTEHFELDVSDAETRQILSRKIGVSDDLFEKMLNTAINRKCFDREIYEERKCLTSIGIKKRANVVVEKRIKSKRDYENKVSATETTQETPTETQQKVHKGKESKNKGNKKESIAFIKSQHLSMTEIEYNKLVELYGKTNVDDKIEYSDNYAKLKNYTSLYKTLGNWLKKDLENPKQLFQKPLNRNRGIEPAEPLEFIDEEEWD
jgi:hypothetical protein